MKLKEIVYFSKDDVLKKHIYPIWTSKVLGWLSNFETNRTVEDRNLVAGVIQNLSNDPSFKNNFINTCQIRSFDIVSPHEFDAFLLNLNKTFEGVNVNIKLPDLTHTSKILEIKVPNSTIIKSISVSGILISDQLLLIEYSTYLSGLFKSRLESQFNITPSESILYQLKSGRIRPQVTFLTPKIYIERLFQDLIAELQNIHFRDLKYGFFKTQRNCLFPSIVSMSLDRNFFKEHSLNLLKILGLSENLYSDDDIIFSNFELDSNLDCSLAFNLIIEPEADKADYFKRFGPTSVFNLNDRLIEEYSFNLVSLNSLNHLVNRQLKAESLIYNKDINTISSTTVKKLNSTFFDLHKELDALKRLRGSLSHFSSKPDADLETSFIENLQRKDLLNLFETKIDQGKKTIDALRDFINNTSISVNLGLQKKILFLSIATTVLATEGMLRLFRWILTFFW